MLLRCFECDLLVEVENDYLPDICPRCSDQPPIWFDEESALLDLMEAVAERAEA